MNRMARVGQSETRWAIARGWMRRLRRRLRARPEKLLRLTETLSLGERRFLAVVEVEQQKFLIGGTSSSVCLLARLGDRLFNSTPPRAAEQWEDVWP